MAYESVSCIENNGAPTKQQSLFQIELATTIPKITSQRSSQITITQSLRTSHIHINAKAIEKSVKLKCPTADIDRLKNRRLEIDGRNQQLIVECAPVVTSTEEKTGDFLYRLKKKPTALAIKQIDTFPILDSKHYY